jgi:hypothetical protein
MRKPRWKRGYMTTRKLGLRINAAAADDDNDNNNIIIVNHWRVLHFGLWFIHPTVKRMN